MDLSVITVTWNSAEKIEKQILSVAMGYRNITCEQIVIDNNSSDNTVELIKKFSNVKLVENKENRGFGVANNQGVEIADGRFILFLNPDMKAEMNTLDRMVNYLAQNPDVGIAGCKLINEDGTVNLATTPRRFPKIWEQLIIILKIHHFFPRILDRYLFRDFDPDKEQEVDSVQGSFMIVRRELIDKLGWAFDPRYFIWFEDVDLCREAKKNGYKVMYTPIAVCVDYAGDSFKKRGTWWKQKQYITSMAKYFTKWGVKL
ncbi:MAG: hypothetical protein A2469_04295 [Candidatus Magasanikbacteria bacterium RIFOXYC2_FULL_40_16]|uniref:Glycosyltransferase 2-like domain-containing protein n=1 Tax=Candidatus Magasanikbacteria bacterium RIFOXYC2_FULL_40_16 TaxID=1798703 RepID=A0A1F6NZB4_9BACT|nr:MAG: hypothetical protein A2301_02385 [Candidatus Magasanikbacteria bacterium RIFOXYB2_FULL_40_13]OGH89218.1 MAG: hypothetical protein A2469_04295 [Candidatus Magasanikbacteria bacterium RIFOXYC2_FULL_40_16]